jgi:hypothetical protein
VCCIRCRQCREVSKAESTAKGKKPKKGELREESAGGPTADPRSSSVQPPKKRKGGRGEDEAQAKKQHNEGTQDEGQAAAPSEVPWLRVVPASEWSGVGNATAEQERQQEKKGSQHGKDGKTVDAGMTIGENDVPETLVDSPDQAAMQGDEKNQEAAEACRRGCVCLDAPMQQRHQSKVGGCVNVWV